MRESQSRPVRSGRAWQHRPLLAAVAASACVLSACRIYPGSTGSQAIDDPTRSASAGGFGETPIADTPERTLPGAGNGDGGSASGAVHGAVTGDAAMLDADGGSVEMTSGADAEAGAPPPSGVQGDGCGDAASIVDCNPITNEGCAGELGMQCDVDLTASTPTGVCVFSAPPPDGSVCLNIPPTESCPAGQTCVGDECRKVCLCDSDCDAGGCCREPLQSTGFKTCSRC